MLNSMKHMFPGSKQQRGFTLVELMTVVLIIGILAALAYPQYARHVMTSRRADAQTALMQTASLLQKYYTECGEYPTGFGAGNPVYNCAARTLTTAVISPETHYVLSIVTLPGPAPTAAPNQGYVLTASPNPGPPASPQIGDVECAALSINDVGQKTVSGSLAATPERCWRR